MNCRTVPEFKFVLNPGLDNTFLPTQADENATGWDVKSAEDIELEPMQTVKIPLGFRCFAPEGYWLELRPRSSTYAKLHLNSLYGVIDESYEGQIMFACQWIPDGLKTNFTLKILKGDRIGQLVPVRRQSMIVTQVSESEFDELCKLRGYNRGTGGFGSTGK